jgi:sugar/nucleoside kinase (ribokinase family)
VAGRAERRSCNHTGHTSGVERDLVAVGDVMLDGSLPEPVAGRHVHGRIRLRPGGSAANAALASAAVGARAAVVGRVGADVAGRLVESALIEGGVEPLLAFDPDASTGCVVALGAASVVGDPGASIRLDRTDLPEALEARAVLVSGYSLLQHGPEAAARDALVWARAQWVAVDAASARLVEAFGAERFFEATARADILFANADEARVLTGLDAEPAAASLARRYRIACVKLGADGAIVASGSDRTRAAVDRVEGAVAFGAGDVLAGVFLRELAGGADLAAALRAACSAATRRLELG